MAVECRRHDFSPGGLPLGILRDPVMDKMRAPIVPGERFYIFTDGLPDAKSLDTAPAPGRSSACAGFPNR
jgi:serine phosphatase RsbU (regulator of sigma subunit)